MVRDKFPINSNNRRSTAPPPESHEPLIGLSLEKFEPNSVLGLLSEDAYT